MFPHFSNPSTKHLTVFLALLLCIGSTWADSGKPASPATPSLVANSPHPQILYWVWKPDTIKDDRFLGELDRIAAKAPFNLVFVYLINGFGFNDPALVKAALAKAVKRAHELGLKLGVSFYYPAHSPTELKGRLQGMLVESETILDATGAGTLEVRAEPQRSLKPAASSLVKAYAFRKTGEGFYDPATLRTLKDEDIMVTSLGTDKLRVEVKSDSDRAGQTLFVMTRHDYLYGDLFTDFFPEQFRKVLDTWADIPLDGVALDEFRYLTPNLNKPFYNRWFSLPMAAAYRVRYGRPMDDDLLAYRYVPEGHPDVRAAAINRYFDLLCSRPADIDRFAMEYSRKLFGPGIFRGFHNTWHNHLLSDEVWGTGINWWNLDRDYGQLDEVMPVPVRLGVGVAYPKPVFYNMFYNKKADAYIDEAVREASVNGRVNYLGLDQLPEWGIEFDDAFLARVNRVENRIRLLNFFNGPRPDTRILVLFGFPSLVNWFPNPAARSPYDINNSLEIERKADTLWKAGIPCALLSTTVIDSGKLTLSKDGKPTINGHTFDALVFIGPEYSKPGTLEFLKKFVDAGGKLIVDGDATRGFDGNPIGSDYDAIAKAAMARECTPAAVAKFGIVQDWPKDGSRLEDGSVLMVDRTTIETDAQHTFSFRIGQHEFTIVASGVTAFKATPDGLPQKLAAARFVSLTRDGQSLLNLDTPADTMLEWTAQGLRSLSPAFSLVGLTSGKAAQP